MICAAPEHRDFSVCRPGEFTEMTKFAERVNRISASPPWRAMMAAKEYHARGIDVVDFGPGEPGFPYAGLHQARGDRGARPELHEVHGHKWDRAAA